MSFTGTLKRISDQDNKWGALIDTDEKGETWFTIFDKKLAGQDSEEHAAICDAHDFAGKRVVFDAKIGNLKKDEPQDGERGNSTITSIALETSSELTYEVAPEIERELSQVPLVIEPADLPARRGAGALSRLALEAVQADLRAHEARAAWLDEVTRIAGGR